VSDHDDCVVPSSMSSWDHLYKRPNGQASNASRAGLRFCWALSQNILRGPIITQTILSYLRQTRTMHCIKEHSHRTNWTELYRATNLIRPTCVQNLTTAVLVIPEIRLGPQNLKFVTIVTMPTCGGFVISRLILHMVNHCTKFEVSRFSHSRDILGDLKM